MFESWQVSALLSPHLLAHLLCQDLLKLVGHVEVQAKDVLILLRGRGRFSDGCRCGLNR